MSQLYFGGFERHPTRKETMTYMRGECAYFALALHALWPTSNLVSVSNVHFAVRDDQGHFWDVRGSMTDIQFKNGMGARSSEQITTVNREEIIALLETGLYSDGFFLPSRQRKASQLLQGLLPTDRLPQARVRRPSARV